MSEPVPYPPPLPPPTRRGGSLGLGCLAVSLVVLLTLGALLLITVATLSGRDTRFLPGTPGVAVLEIREELVDERPILEDLERLIDHPSTRALVVRVDSPGGAITVVEEVYEALKRARDQEGLPVVASMGAVAASGGYFVCLAAQEIYTNNSTLTGSIGVIIEYTNAEALLDKVGVDFTQIKSGEYKGAGSFFEGITERQQQHMQELVDGFHAYFVETVVKERGLSPEAVNEIANGRLFTGREAVAYGLADHVGDLDAAIKHAAALAGLPDSDPRVIRVYRTQPFLPRLLQQIESASASVRRSWLVPKYVMRY